ncbi:hypothetical protein II898_00805 [bacterium]|nr:hypothetical protein [bacterium]
MRNLIILEVLLFFSLFVFAEEAVSFSKYETEHQILYFSSNLDPSVVDRLIADAERSEEFIKALYGWVPKKKIAVVYDRETDTANGWSNAFMKNSIFLYLYPPDRYSTLSSYKNWEFGLHVHEYTHSTQIGQARGFPRVMNLIFGDFYFIGGTVPTWMLEGAAVYSESVSEGKGRLNSPLYKKYLYSFFDAGTELKLGELSGVTDHWLGGNLPYLYGTFFYAYLIEHVGADGMKRFFEELSDDFFPFLMTRAGKMAFRKSIYGMYKDFIKENREKVQSGKSAKPWTEKRFSRVYADISGDGYKFFAANPSERALFSYDGKKINKISMMSSIDSFAEKEGKVIFTQTVKNGGRLDRSELFLKEENSAIKKLTENGSVLEAFFGKNDDIFFTSFRDGINRITRIDMSGKVLKEWEFPAIDSIYSLSFLENGKVIAFTGNRFESEKNIFLFDTKSGELREIEIDGEQYSVYFENEKTLVFSSENDENIVPLRLDLGTNELVKLCEPPYPALFPKVQDKKVYYLTFDNDGYYPDSCDMKTNGQKLSPAVVKVIEKGEKAKLQHELTKAKGYEGMLPALWFPQFDTNFDIWMIGATVMGKSNDQMRSYDITYTKTFGGSGRHYVLLNYYDEAVLPSFRAFFTYSNQAENIDDPDISRILTNRFMAGVSSTGVFTHPASGAFSDVVSVGHSLGWSLGLGGVAMDVKEPDQPQQTKAKDEDDVILSFGLNYGFNLSFNSSSRFLSEPMNNFSISAPVVFSKLFLTEQEELVFAPEITLSFLLSESGKVGFVTKNSFYIDLFSDDEFAVTGAEEDFKITSFNNFIGRNSYSLLLRGFNSATAEGHHAFLSKNELVFHIVSLESNLGAFPLMFRNIQGAVFFDAGSVSDDPNMFDNKFSLGTGFEIRLLTYIVYRAPLMWIFGTGYGLTDKHDVSFYFNVGM